jgi:hypothetical protein
VLDTQRSEYFGINRSGSVLWKAIAAGTSHSELIDVLVERYGLDKQAAARHVEDFTDGLRGRGLLETAP